MTKIIARICSPALIVALVAAVSWSPPAEAQESEGLAACGDISIGLDASCVGEPPGIECETKCTEPAMQISCAADLVVVCAPECTQTVVETEVQVCTQSCVLDCEANPGSFSCSASCGAECSGGCATSCSGSLNEAQCIASCEANCSASCGAECNLVLPSLSCDQRCEPSCRGVVKAEVTMQCQLACHEQRFVTCEEELVQTCQTDCQTREGALFCEGQFVDHEDNLEQCIDALQNLEITVEGGFFFSTSGGCSLGGDALPTTSSLGLFGLLAALAVVARRRRR